jgi:hypothetical protein
MIILIELKYIVSLPFDWTRTLSPIMGVFDWIKIIAV